MVSDDEQHIAVYGDEDLDVEDDELSEEEDQTLQNQHIDEDVYLIDDEDEEEEDDSLSSAADEVTIAVSGASASAGVPNAAAPVTPIPTILTTASTDSILQSDAVVDVKKPTALDDSRRLFQRLWTDEDEIELLQGFLDYTTQRGTNSMSHHHHDTTAFYDQIKGKLQLDFNKNQLVEKIRRLKKKYRNVLGKISSGKEYVFKSPHDQTTFELSCKIWGETAAVNSIAVAADSGGIEDEELQNPNPNPNFSNNSHPNFNISFNLNEHNGKEIADPNSSEKKVPRPRKRSRPTAVKVEENYNQQQQYVQTAGVGASNSNPAIPNLVEETVKSCLLPLFKELVNNSGSGGLGLGSMNMNLFGGLMNVPIGDMSDEKWRKQHISELEVYSKRLELMQDQVKSKLEELRSMGN